MADIERVPFQSPDLIQERADDLPEDAVKMIEKAGGTTVSHHVTTQVKDDNGQPLTQSPTTQSVKITIPAPQSQLQSLAKGPVTNSVTWFAKFWLRAIKKAMNLGSQVVTKGD